MTRSQPDDFDDLLGLIFRPKLEKKNDRKLFSVVESETHIEGVEAQMERFISIRIHFSLHYRKEQT